MGILSADLVKQTPLRIVAYGGQRTRKTLWSLRAALANYNVLYIDGESGYKIGRVLPPEAQKRVFRLNVQDSMGAPRMQDIVAKLLYGKKFYYNDDTGNVSYMPLPDHITIDIRALDTNTVMVIDSLTALSSSIVRLFADTHSIDLADASKVEWDGYGFAKRLLNWMFEMLAVLPCHVIMIGHSTVYEKYKVVGEKRILDWSKTIISSVSGPTSLTLLRGFDEIMYFHLRGLNTFMNCEPTADREEGGRCLKPGAYQFGKLDFGDVVTQSGGTNPDGKQPFLSDIFTPQKSPVKSGVTMASLLAQKSGAILQPATQTT